MEKERFTQVLLDMTDTLFRVAAIQLRQPADREDAVQECLRRAWEKRQHLQDERYVQTWVICILLNECHRMQRRMSWTVPVESVAAVQHQEDSELKEALMQLATISLMIDLTDLKKDDEWMSHFLALQVLDENGNVLCETGLSAIKPIFQGHEVKQSAELYLAMIPAELAPTGDTFTLRMLNPDNVARVYDQYTYTMK